MSLVLTGVVPERVAAIINTDETVSLFHNPNNFYQAPNTPTCPVCKERINWCLDMMTFTTGFANETQRFTLAHARCIWTKEAFERQMELAKEGL